MVHNLTLCRLPRTIAPCEDRTPSLKNAVPNEKPWAFLYLVPCGIYLRFTPYRQSISVIVLQTTLFAHSSYFFRHGHANHVQPAGQASRIHELPNYCRRGSRIDGTAHGGNVPGAIYLPSNGMEQVSGWNRPNRDRRLSPTKSYIWRACPISGKFREQRCDLIAVSSYDLPTAILCRIADDSLAVFAGWNDVACGTRGPGGNGCYLCTYV
jgi:hypothetical protein